MRLRRLDELTPQEWERAFAAGGRLTYFDWCISLGFATLRRPSAPYLLRSGQWGWWRGLPYTILTLICGWWGVPWGLVYTPLALWTNLTGGRTITAEEWHQFQALDRRRNPEE